MTRAGLKRCAYFLVAPLLSLVLYRRVLDTWFVEDDFAWLDLPRQVYAPHELWRVLFAPKAQGTVRVLSERLFFLVFSSVFGLNELPYRLWVLGTWFADLTLLALIGTRMFGSRAAGLAAAVLWAASANLVLPLGWASAYNEVLCALCILAAFYSRLRWLESGARKWRFAEWAAYIAGFGALEIIVVYPLLALLHAVCAARKHWRSTLPLFVPAAIFGALHLLFIPKTLGPAYALAVDRRLPMNLLTYLGWALGPIQIAKAQGEGWRLAGLIVTAAIGAALSVFVFLRLRRGGLLAVFCLGWFLLTLAPVLPFPNHVIEYYLTAPLAGLALLGGWALISAWNAGSSLRWIAVALAALYLAGSTLEIDYFTNWARERAGRMRALVMGVEQSIRAHPGSAILLEGVDRELFESGFKDDPFRLVGLGRIYLVENPDAARNDAPLSESEESSFRMSSAQALGLLQLGQARVLAVSAGAPRDITGRFEAGLALSGVVARRDLVDVGDPRYAAFLGPTWHRADHGYRWMPKIATVKLSGPASAPAKLYVTGFVPEAVLASGPLTADFRASGRDLGSVKLSQPGERFSLEFDLPPDLVGQPVVEIQVEVSKVLRESGGDRRELGLVFGTFGIR